MSVTTDTLDGTRSLDVDARPGSDTRVELSSGEYSVAWSAEGSPASASVRIAAGEITTLRLTRGRRIPNERGLLEILVTDPMGFPLEGATARVYGRAPLGEDHIGILTGESGRGQALLVPGSYRIEFGEYRHKCEIVAGRTTSVSVAHDLYGQLTINQRSGTFFWRRSGESGWEAGDCLEVCATEGVSVTSVVRFPLLKPGTIEIGFQSATWTEGIDTLGSARVEAGRDTVFEYSPATGYARVEVEFEAAPESDVPIHLEFVRRSTERPRCVLRACAIATNRSASVDVSDLRQGEYEVRCWTSQHAASSQVVSVSRNSGPIRFRLLRG